MELTGAIITLAGSVFLFLGALGVLRMPDVFNRMQAGTKATTLGTILFLSGIAINHHNDNCVFKIIILILFIILTNPVSSHVLARAAHHAGAVMAKNTVRDELSDMEKINEEK